MGKLITMWVFLDRRSFGDATEGDARRQRGFNEWMASRYAPDGIVARGGKPQIQPESKAQLKVVKMRQWSDNLQRANLRGPFADIIRRVTAAGERIRERHRAEREQVWRESIARMLRERRERLSAPPASNVIAFRRTVTKAKRRRRRAKVIKLEQA